MTADARVESINSAISYLPGDVKGKISDGYHTFDQLYDHRVALFVALCGFANRTSANPYLPNMSTIDVWKSKSHFDGSMYDGWFIAGIVFRGKQISYHLPIAVWDKLDARIIPHSPEWDGHTSEDVLERIYDWFC